MSAECDACGGDHATKECPHFRKPRGAHTDAQPPAAEQRAPPSTRHGKVVVKGVVKPQPADGSCLYHALCHGCMRYGIKGLSAAALRRKLASWTVANKDKSYNGQTIATWLKWEAGVEPRRYAALQSRRGWGGAIEIAR